MKIIRTLHLASFDGNIGDNANHNGFYRYLKNIHGTKFEIEELEIREFYWKKRYFDESFVEQVNSFDLLIIGGGNYFELWVEHSPTGTSIMIEPELFEKIKIPVLFNALGVDPGQGATKESCEKFRKFLNVILENPKNFISVRNDGSIKTIKEYIGQDYAARIAWTPDAGVCVETDNGFCLVEKNKTYVAINLAADMLETRFKNNENNITPDEFTDSIAILCSKIIDEKIADEIVFIPHIYKDIKLIKETIDKLPDNIIRTRINIAPLLHGINSELKIFSIYKSAKISLSMRFHANLCSVGLSTPTIGLSTYRQIDMLYKELNLENLLISANKKNFHEELIAKTKNISNNYEEYKNIFRDKSKEQNKLYAEYIERVESWLNITIQNIKHYETCGKITLFAEPRVNST